MANFMEVNRFDEQLINILSRHLLVA